MRVSTIAGLLAIAVIAMLAWAGPASASYVHPAEDRAFGPDGTSETDFTTLGGFKEKVGLVEGLAFDQSLNRLYAYTKDAEYGGEEHLYAFNVGGPEATEPVGGNYPKRFECPLRCEGAVDESSGPSAHRTYWGTQLWYGEAGPTTLSADAETIPGLNFQPESGYKCGVAVDSAGHVFVVNEQKKQIEEFESVGGPPVRTISVSNLPETTSYGPCHLAIDKQTGDMFVGVHKYLYRLTEEANYEDLDPMSFTVGEPPYYETYGLNMAIDESTGILYASSAYSWRAFDIETGAKVEERYSKETEYSNHGNPINGIAVDEDTHIVFTSNQHVWQIEEWLPVAGPDVSTGEPTGNTTISGHIDPAGAGNVTECKFEYVPASAFNSVQEVKVSGATGGTYKLYNYAVNTYSNPIPYNATIAEFKQDVEATWGAGTVSVTGSDGGPYTVELVGPLAGASPGQFFPNYEGTLTPSNTARVTVTTKQNGGQDAWKSASTAPCNPAAPISAPTQVSASLPGLTNETTYHYRLVATYGNGTAVGGEKTITPHKVTALTTEQAEEVERASAELHGSYEGNGQPVKWWFEWGTSPKSLTESSTVEEETTTGGTGVSTVAEGLEPGTIYFFRVSAENAQGESHGEIRKFKTLPAVQGLTTQAATEIKPHTAKLNASYVGDGAETEYFYEWGTSRLYGHETPVEVAEATGPEDLEPALITGLEPEKTYHFRVVATNNLGTTFGRDETFRTVPAVTGLEVKAPSSVTPHAATLEGAYTGDGTETTYHYEWGKSTAYLSGKSPDFNTCEGGPCPTGPTSLQSYPISNLEPETTYHVRIVATNPEGTTKSADFTFRTPQAVPGLKTLPASNITQESIQLNAEFNGNGEDVHYYFEYGTDPKHMVRTAEPPGEDAGSPTGPTHLQATITDYLAYKTYKYRVIAEDAEGAAGPGPHQTVGEWVEFTPLPALLPSIRNTAVSDISPTAATFHAEIDPNRWDTVYLFEWGPTTAYGGVTELSEPIGNDHSYHAVTNAISGLEPATTYHFRVVAINFTGTQWGPDQLFSTPGAPAVDLASASNVTDTTAHLDSFVKPNSVDTVVHFEYGTTPAYGVSTPGIDIGSGRGDQNAGVDLTGLTPNTTYHFKAVATNSLGTSESRDATFTTGPALAQPQPQPNGHRCKKGQVKRHGRCVKKPHHKRHHHKKKRHHRNSNHRNG